MHGATTMLGFLAPGRLAAEYEFMVPVYNDVASQISLEAVSFHGAIVLILLVAIVLFKFKLRPPKKYDEE
jgi:tetrahydromethanopterin S-methyltransferase subunit E